MLPCAGGNIRLRRDLCCCHIGVVPHHEQRSRFFQDISDRLSGSGVGHDWVEIFSGTGVY
jgi:hypothetical protein